MKDLKSNVTFQIREDGVIRSTNAKRITMHVDATVGKFEIPIEEFINRLLFVMFEQSPMRTFRWMDLYKVGGPNERDAGS